MQWMIHGANGYSLSIAGSLTVVDPLLKHHPRGGGYTPAMLARDRGARLPGSGTMEIE